MNIFRGGNPTSIENEKRRADLYSRLYQYASEDFVNYQDMYSFIQELFIYINTIEQKLINLFVILQNHTHKIVPHTHNIPPHLHISGRPGDPTSPTPTVTLPNLPIEGLLPTQKPRIFWPRTRMPLTLTNTTTAITNRYNKINLNISANVDAGEDGPHKRRATPIRILQMPSIPQYLVQGAKSAVS